MRRLAVIAAVLDNAEESQLDFNNIVSNYKGIIKGRMGIPFTDEGISIITLVVLGTPDQINTLTGTLGKIKDVHVKTSFSKKEID
jgi:putative iron-only hydrogenase system regulator